MTLVLMILWVIQLIGVIYTINKTYIYFPIRTLCFLMMYIWDIYPMSYSDLPINIIGYTVDNNEIYNGK